MHKILIAGSLLFAAIFCGVVRAQSDGRSALPLAGEAKASVASFEPAQSAALFVGVRRFLYDKTLAEVRYAVDDAIDLAYVIALEEQVRLVDPSRVILALSGEPQKPESRKNLERLVAAGVQVRSAGGADILSALDEQARVVGSKGLLVIAFATHGFSSDGNQYLLSATSLLHHRQETISESEIRDIASQSEAARSLILIDACRERLTDDRRTLGPDPTSAASLLMAMAGIHGQVVLSAAAAGQYAYDDDGRRNGVFTAAVIDGLRCEASADENGLITADALSSFVETRVLTWIRKYRNVRTAAATQVSSEGSAKGMPLAICRERAIVGRTLGTAGTTGATRAPVAVHEERVVKTKSETASPVSLSSGRTLDVVDESGQLVPELVVAARSLDETLSLSAQLKTNLGPPDERLEGLITTSATLEVRITRGSEFLDAFTLESTGVGFTKESSARQARERLATSLSQRLVRAHP